MLCYCKLIINGVCIHCTFSFHSFLLFLSSRILGVVRYEICMHTWIIMFIFVWPVKLWPHPLKGHLSRYLSFHHGLSVTAVEAESSHLTAATRLDRYNNNSFRRTPLNIKTPLFNKVFHCFVEKWVMIWRGKEEKMKKKERKLIETSGILNIRWADKIHWCV